MALINRQVKVFINAVFHQPLCTMKTSFLRIAVIGNDFGRMDTAILFHERIVLGGKVVVEANKKWHSLVGDGFYKLIIVACNHQSSFFVKG